MVPPDLGRRAATAVSRSFNAACTVVALMPPAGVLTTPDAGNPVQLVSVPLAGVPSAGVVRAAPVMATVPPDAGSMALVLTVLMNGPQRKTRVAPDVTVSVTPDATVSGPTMDALKSAGIVVLVESVAAFMTTGTVSAPVIVSPAFWT